MWSSDCNLARQLPCVQQYLSHFEMHIKSHSYSNDMSPKRLAFLGYASASQPQKPIIFVLSVIHSNSIIFEANMAIMAIILSLSGPRTVVITPVHRGALFQFLFRWIYYCHSSKSTRKETGKMQLCAVLDHSCNFHLCP